MSASFDAVGSLPTTMLSPDPHVDHCDIPPPADFCYHAGGSDEQIRQLPGRADHVLVPLWYRVHGIFLCFLWRAGAWHLVPAREGATRATRTVVESKYRPGIVGSCPSFSADIAKRSNTHAPNLNLLQVLRSHFAVERFGFLTLVVRRNASKLGTPHIFFL